MKWSYTSWVMRQSSMATEDRLIREQHIAREAAKDLSSQDSTIAQLIERLAGWLPMGSVRLVYLDEHGLRKEASASTPWSMLRHIASSEYLARPVSLIFNSDFGAIDLMWKLDQVKETVRLVEEKINASQGNQSGV
jgi:hypothetical protein